jgi:hypothetical protein
MEVQPRYFPGGTEEYHKIYQDCQCLDRDSIPEPSKYKCRALSLTLGRVHKTGDEVNYINFWGISLCPIYTIAYPILSPWHG